jgi:DNA (cytosine-5)-methyltransferase 1
VGVNELHLFAGAGGGILAGQLLGHRCIGAVEIDPYCRAVLAARQADGTLPAFPVFTDIRTFDARPYRGRADIVAGGFPCQDISTAGTGDGLDGERSGLWSEFERVLRAVRPQYAFIENSPAIVGRGLDRILSDLAALRFDARWCVLSAADLGAPHRRERAWILAHSVEVMGQARARVVEQPREPAVQPWCYDGIARDREGRWVEMATQFSRMDDGMAYSVERTEAIGNGQVPSVAAAAFAMLAAEFD